MDTPALIAAAPLSPPRPTSRPRRVLLSRPSGGERRLLGWGLAVGLSCALWLDGAPLGLGLALTVALAAGALARLSGREGWQAARGQRWLVVLAVGLAALVVVRDSPWLVALNVGMALWLLLLAAWCWSGEEPVGRASVAEVLAGPAAVAAHGLWQGARVTRGALRGVGRPVDVRGGAVAALRLGMVAAPVLLGVGALLARGDASFAARLALAWAALGELPLGTALRVVVVTAALGPPVAGVLAWALRRRRDGALTPVGPGLRLRAVEAFVVVGGLAALLAVYGAVTADCALSPGACVLPAGMTYAEYAREGFFELLAAAAVVVGVLVGVPGRLREEEGHLERALRVTATVLAVATVPLLAGAFRRLGLYEAVYGATRLRVSCQVSTVALGLVLAWRALTLWAWPRRFAAGVVACAALTVVALNAVDLDAHVARVNLALAERTGQLDVEYLASLSADAVPVFAEALSPDDPPTRRAWGAALLSRPVPQDGLLGFNLARLRAQRLVRPATMQDATCSPGGGEE